jgi:hypothetical protein
MDEQRLVTLPRLAARPKEFNMDEKFVVRDSVLELFRKYEVWSLRTKPEEKYGRYVAGPEGIGKSVALYFVSCLARAMNWFVIYIARCDQWISMSWDEVTAIRYFAKQAASSIAPFRGTPKLRWQKKIADIFHTSDPPTSRRLMGEFLNELHEYDSKEYPILLVFDEANALHTEKAAWNNEVAFKTTPFKIAASLDIISFARGFKLISGTGNENFLNTFMSSLNIAAIDRFAPYTVAEFKYLLSTELCPDIIRTVLQKLPDEKDQLIQDLIAIIGTVPRQLKFIKSYAEEINGQQTSGYKNAFHQLLAGYARRTIASFLQQHTNFLKSLDPPERLKMINSTFLVLIGERGPMSIPPAYLDTSIVYMHDDKTYDMVTPLAAKAVVQAFRNEGEIETLADYRDGWTPQNLLITAADLLSVSYLRSSSSPVIPKCELLDVMALTNACTK